MAAGDLTPGRRVFVPAHQLEPGDYCFDPAHQVWFCRPPVALELLGNLIRHDVAECDDGSITVSPSIAIRCGEADYTVDEADGIRFLCPKCWETNGNSPIGTHSVICWRPRVGPDRSPKPGRWDMVGTYYADLSLVAGSSSVHLTGPGCGAHFLVTNGVITWA